MHVPYILTHQTGLSIIKKKPKIQIFWINHHYFTPLQQKKSLKSTYLHNFEKYFLRQDQNNLYDDVLPSDLSAFIKLEQVLSENSSPPSSLLMLEVGLGEIQSNPKYILYILIIGKYTQTNKHKKRKSSFHLGIHKKNRNLFKFKRRSNKNENKNKLEIYNLIIKLIYTKRKTNKIFFLYQILT